MEKTSQLPGESSLRAFLGETATTSTEQGMVIIKKTVSD